MDLGIQGKTAAVAASSTGLGLGCAQALVAEGVRVALCSRDQGRVEAAATKLGDTAVPLVADLGTRAGAEDFITQAIAALGQVDILIANAGWPTTRHLRHHDDGRLRRSPPSEPPLHRGPCAARPSPGCRSADGAESWRSRRSAPNSRSGTSRPRLRHAPASPASSRSWPPRSRPTA